jgi:hypothetical protein|nr:MAG TPA: hypothetical protein [Myoviridae sp. ctTS62]
MFNWLKTLLRKPLDLPETPVLDVPIRYVNTTDVSFGLNLPGYFRICMNLETGKITKKHIEGVHVTDEIVDLDCQLAYDKLPDEYKRKYRTFLERMNAKIQY